MNASNMRASDRDVVVWDPVLRLFHWLLVIGIALAFLSSEEDSPLAPWHVATGWSIAILLAIRCTWGVVGGEHARFARFVKPAALGAHCAGLVRGRPDATLGHNALGAFSVLLLMAMVAATVVSGAAGLDGDVHEMLAYATLALVAVHVAAVIVMTILTRDGLVRAMITGRKRLILHPGAKDAHRASRWGYVATLVVAVGTIAAVLAYDPTAFRPQLDRHALAAQPDPEHGD
jgi:cytochrome b